MAMVTGWKGAVGYVFFRVATLPLACKSPVNNPKRRDVKDSSKICAEALIMVEKPRRTRPLGFLDANIYK